MSDMKVIHMDRNALLIFHCSLQGGSKPAALLPSCRLLIPLGRVHFRTLSHDGTFPGTAGASHQARKVRVYQVSWAVITGGDIFITEREKPLHAIAEKLTSLRAQYSNEASQYYTKVIRSPYEACASYNVQSTPLHQCV